LVGGERFDDGEEFLVGPLEAANESFGAFGHMDLLAQFAAATEAK
jgi:hypothetical protein